jgi:hypothetical protein
MTVKSIHQPHAGKMTARADSRILLASLGTRDDEHF